MNYINYFKSFNTDTKRVSKRKRLRLNTTLTKHQEQLKKSDIDVLKALLAAFPKVYWDSDTLINDKSLYELLLELEKDKQILLIPELIGLSKSYNKYVFWAKEILDKLSIVEQRQIQVPALSWTSDMDYTLISSEEIAYRKRQNLKCLDEYSRPCQTEDLLCFKTWLDIVSATESSCLFFNG